MLIEFIRVENWRSFHGLNDFFVSTDPERNVTLIRAENGVGKTSLLAAINWCFFGILPAESEFENPTKLVNEFALENAGTQRATVSIDFRHEGRTYRACRMYEQRTETAHGLKLTELVDGGEVPSAKERPDRFINSVVPREMAPHFFFYGEATSRYTGTTGARKFGEAVKGILGSTVARMALDDLRKAWQDYNKQASDNTSADPRFNSEEITVFRSWNEGQKGYVDNHAANFAKLWSGDPSPRRMVADLVLARTRAIVMVDNCTPDTHRALAETCRAENSNVSLLTVEYDIRDDEPEGTDVFRLEPATEAVVERMLERRAPHLADPDRRRIAEIAGGNFRIALGLADTVERGRGLGTVTDAELFERLFRQRRPEDPSLSDAARALSLAYSFDGEDASDESELARLATLVGQGPNDLYRAAAELEARGLPAYPSAGDVRGASVGPR